MTYSIDTLMKLYENKLNFASKTQWRSLLGGNLESPLTVVNFFKFREEVDLRIVNESMSGEEAFNKYAETSIPKVAEVGGHFLLLGTVESDFIGENLEQWDLMAIGQYPQRKAFIELLMDEVYQAAFRYRMAAIENQNVYFVRAL